MSKKKKKKFTLIKKIILLGIIVSIYCYFNPSIIDNLKNILPLNRIKIINLNSKSRPIAVMINNHDSARPYHSGLQDAYIIYEMIAEGGYTRYMALFKDKDTERIGSVRSSRHYFLDYVLENDAIYVHWGWSPKAENDIKELKINNINGLLYENKYFYRDDKLPISLEHTGYTNMNYINKAIEDLDYNNKTNTKTLLNYSNKPIKIADIENSKKANSIGIEYSSLTKTSYEYDQENKVYKRFVNGNKHIDYITKEQYTFKNIIIYQVENNSIDDYGRQTINNLGSGEGYYISEGYAIPIKWQKDKRNERTIYRLENGKELTVNDGNTFIQIQPVNKNLSIT